MADFRAALRQSITTLSAPPPTDPTLQVFIAIDGSSKRDSTAIVIIAADGDDGVRLIDHRIFIPHENDPIDFEQVERVLLDYKKKFPKCTIIFDSTQLEFMMQRLRRAGLSCEEFKQTPANITDMTQVLYDLVRYKKLAVYPNQQLRHAVTNMLVVEKSTGMRFAGSKQQKDHTDSVTALAMAALRCVQRNQSSLRARFPHYDFDYKGFSPDADAPPAQPEPETPFIGNYAEWWKWRPPPRPPLPTAPKIEPPKERPTNEADRNLLQLYRGLDGAFRNGY
ncbi:MAG: hypothetical protein WAV38_19355 [Xanthobacteraceae bacterium]